MLITSASRDRGGALRANEVLHTVEQVTFDANTAGRGDFILWPEAASKLFASLRALDRPPFSGIAVMPIPDTGLGAAINDRLRRAAAPRPPSP